MAAPFLVFAAFGLLQRSAATAAALQQDQCTGADCDDDGASLPRRGAAAAVASRQDRCAGDFCGAGGTFFLQSMVNRVKKDVSLKSHEECYPCEIAHKPPNGRPDLKMDIYLPKEATGEGPYPVVIAHHGSGGGVKTMQEQCTYVIAPAGFVCASISPVRQDPKFYADDAIEYFKSHPEYQADPDMVILYGHSKGGRGVFEYMFRTEMPTRSNVKGFIQDASSAAAKNFDWKKKDAKGNYLKFPPLLMLHCESDRSVPTRRSVDQTIPRIRSANKVRGPDEQIVYHYIEFKKGTGCSHPPLVVNSWEGAQAAVLFINGIAAGEENPFAGLPAAVSGRRKATSSRRRRGEPNWFPQVPQEDAYEEEED